MDRFAPYDCYAWNITAENISDLQINVSLLSAHTQDVILTLMFAAALILMVALIAIVLKVFLTRAPPPDMSEDD